MAALIQIQSQCFPILNMQYGNITKYEQDTIPDIVHTTVLSNLVLILIAEENELRKKLINLLHVTQLVICIAETHTYLCLVLKPEFLTRTPVAYISHYLSME